MTRFEEKLVYLKCMHEEELARLLEDCHYINNVEGYLVYRQGKTILCVDVIYDRGSVLFDVYVFQGGLRDE